MAKKQDNRLTPPVSPIIPPSTNKPATSTPSSTLTNKPADKPATPIRIKSETTSPRLKAKPQELPEVEEEKDYLQKYQVKKQTKSGSIDSNPSKGSKAERMKKSLLEQDKIRMLIPRPMGEDKRICQSVTLNGYRLDFPKDGYIEVPLQVAEVLAESLKQTNVALSQNLIDGNKNKEDALR